MSERLTSGPSRAMHTGSRRPPRTWRSLLGGALGRIAPGESQSQLSPPLEVDQRICWAAAIMLMMLAAEAGAQQIGELIVQRVTSFLVLSLLALTVLQIGYIRLGVWLLKLEGGLARATGAVLLGGLLGGVLGFAGSMLVLTMPPAVRGVVMGGVGFVAGGLGVKLLFKTDLVRGMIVYLLAATANMVSYSLILILVY